MKEKIYYVVSNYGTVFGVFSTRERAENCLRHYKNLMPDSDLEINWDIKDLINY